MGIIWIIGAFVAIWVMCEYAWEANKNKQQIMGKQNRKLLENIERYEEEKIKQSKPQILGQKPVKRQTNKRKNTRMYHSQWGESVYRMV